VSVIVKLNQNLFQL